MAAAVVAAFAVSAHGQLLVTEFMPNPAGTDTEGEWIEIFNSGSIAMSLDGYKVGDEETPLWDIGGTGGTEGMYSFPTGTIMAAGQVYVIALKATGFAALYPGQLPDFEITDTDPTVPEMAKYLPWATGVIAMSNTGDHALIVDPSDAIVDGANHGDATIFYTGAVTLLSGESYERINPYVDTDTAADWVVRPAGFSTPGLVIIPEPSALALGLLAVSLFVARRRV